LASIPVMTTVKDALSYLGIEFKKEY
jgi:hypothetical protein